LTLRELVISQFLFVLAQLRRKGLRLPKLIKILLLRLGEVPEGVNFNICQMLCSCYFTSFLSHSWPITEGTSHAATLIAQAMELGGSAKRKNEGGGGIVGGVSKKKAGGDRCVSHIYTAKDLTEAHFSLHTSVCNHPVVLADFSSTLVASATIAHACHNYCLEFVPEGQSAKRPN